MNERNPVIGIVGRVNVGKSSILNAIARRRVSIVSPTPGTTRDVVSAIVKYQGYQYEFIDTGGFYDEKELLKEASSKSTLMNFFRDIGRKVIERIFSVLENSDLLLFVVDAQTGITSLDIEFSKYLKEIRSKTLLVANKCDNPQIENKAYQFEKMGLGKPLTISAAHNIGINSLMEQITLSLPYKKPISPSEEKIRIAIIGKRNVGKSTFINTLIGEERMIVSDLPGTTRDMVEINFKFGNKNLTIIDTAGFFNKGKVKEKFEEEGLRKSILAMRRAHGVLLLLDCTQPVSLIDKQLVSLLTKTITKPFILCLNKCDLIDNDQQIEKFKEYIADSIPSANYAPISFISALENINVTESVETLLELIDTAKQKVSKTLLNIAIAKIKEEKVFKCGGRLGKVYYATQSRANLPTFTVYVNNTKLFKDAEKQYITNQLQKYLPFGEIPIKVLLKKLGNRR